MSTQQSLTAPSSPLPSTPSLRPSVIRPDGHSVKIKIHHTEVNAERESDDPPIHNVSSFALPKPYLPNLIAPQRRPSSRSTAKGIAPLTDLNAPAAHLHTPEQEEYVPPSFTDSIPRSFRSFGSSTARPPIKPVSLASTTVKADSYDRDLWVYENILNNGGGNRRQPAMEHTGDTAGERGETTIMPGRRARAVPDVLLKRRASRSEEEGEEGGEGEEEKLSGAQNCLAVDELACEWCWFCGCERERGFMELRDIGQGDGLQWVCKGKCSYSPNQELNLGVGPWGRAERLRRISGEIGGRKRPGG